MRILALLLLLAAPACQNTAPAPPPSAVDAEAQAALIAAIEELQAEVVKLRLELRRANMTQETALESDELRRTRAALAQRHDELAIELVTMRTKFADQHPSIQAVKAELTAVRERLDEVEAALRE